MTKWDAAVEIMQENARECGKAWIFQVAVEDCGLEEWEGLDYTAFCQALANANDPAFFSSFERAGCIQHLSERERERFDEADGDADLYSAAVEAAWDELQRLLAENEEADAK